MDDGKGRKNYYRVAHLVREYPPNLVPYQLEHTAPEGRERLPNPSENGKNKRGCDFEFTSAII